MTGPTPHAAVPQDHDAERIVLGAMMLTADAVAEVEDVVGVDDFHHPAHGRIFTTIKDLHAAGDPTTTVAVADRLGRHLGRIGGAGYLHTLLEAVPTVANAGYYAHLVRNAAKLRRLLEFATRARHIGETAHGSGTSPDQAIERVREHLAELDAIAGGNGPVVWRDIITPALDAIEQAADHDGPRGLPTGLPDLDDVLNGLQAGQLAVVAGRPGSGKSILGAQFAVAAAMRYKLPAAIFSLEMRRNELFNRIIAARTNIDLARIIAGKLSDDEWTRIARACGETEDAPLYIDDTPGVSVADIRARARRMYRQHNLRMIVVDYLQLLEAPRGIDNRQQQVSAMSRSLKLLAQELEIPVVLAAQLNRNPEQRSDHRPKGSDLRESGAIEQDADVIILIHREEQHDSKTTRVGEADLIIDKNRNGPRTTITVAAQLHYARFVSMAYDPPATS